MRIRHNKPSQDKKEKASNLPLVIWRDPGDISTLNLFYGAGGKEDAPDPHGTYSFVKEDLNSTSPKFDVEDVRAVGFSVETELAPSVVAGAPSTENWAEALHADPVSCILPVGRKTKIEILDKAKPP